MATMYISKITPLGSSTTYNIKDLEAIQSIATGDNNGQIKITPRSGNAYNVSVKGLGSNAYTSTAYLPLAGGTMTGSITFNKQANAIAYTGTKQTYNMIKFKDNTADTYGNGIIIGGGGLAVIGGGESADTIAATHTSGGDEVLDLTSDGNVYVWTGVQSGAESAKKFTFNQDGTFDSPGAIKVNGTPVLTAHQTVTNKNATLAWSTTSTIATIGSTDIKITMPANPDTHHTAYIRAGASGGTANAATTTGNTYLNLVENNTNRSGVKLVPGSNMEITSDANGNVTFKATDTTYSSKAAASGGTDVSLVTTGEKYTWNSKADGNHTHTTSLAADTGTSSITLAYGGKYKLTTGGTSVIFTMPADSNVDTKVTQNNTTTNSDYRILLSTSANDDAETNTINKNTNLRYNPSTNTLSTGNITGTGNLNITGNANLNSETYAASITAGSLLVNGNANFVQIPTAPTPVATSNDTSVATTAFVMNAFTANDAMVFKGVVNANGDLPATHKQGWTYRVATAGTYAGKVCEVGDIIICVTDGTAANNDHWAVIQNNVDGAVYRGTNAFTDANIIVADSTNGKVKSSGKTITATAPSSSDTDTTIPTSKAVWSAISGASGYGKTGTVTSITLKAGSGISLDTDNTAITTSGTRTISIAGLNTSTGSTSSVLSQKGTWVNLPTVSSLGLDSLYKAIQTAVTTATDNSTTNTRFVSSITQDTNGVITVTTELCPVVEVVRLI